MRTERRKKQSQNSENRKPAVTFPDARFVEHPTKAESTFLDARFVEQTKGVAVSDARFVEHPNAEATVSDV